MEEDCVMEDNDAAMSGAPSFVCVKATGGLMRSSESEDVKGFRTGRGGQGPLVLRQNNRRDRLLPHAKDETTHERRIREFLRYSVSSDCREVDFSEFTYNHGNSPRGLEAVAFSPDQGLAAADGARVKSRRRQHSQTRSHCSVQSALPADSCGGTRSFASPPLSGRLDAGRACRPCPEEPAAMDCAAFVKGEVEAYEGENLTPNLSTSLAEVSASHQPGEHSAAAFQQPHNFIDLDEYADPHGFYTDDVACCSSTPAPRRSSRAARMKSNVEKHAHAQRDFGKPSEILELSDSDTDREDNGANCAKICDHPEVDGINFQTEVREGVLQPEQPDEDKARDMSVDVEFEDIIHVPIEDVLQVLEEEQPGEDTARNMGGDVKFEDSVDIPIEEILQVLTGMEQDDKEKAREMSAGVERDNAPQDLTEIQKADGIPSGEHAVQTQVQQESSVFSLATGPPTPALAPKDSVACEVEISVLVETQLDCKKKSSKLSPNCNVPSRMNADSSEQLSSGSRCDLCNLGPSLSLGEWFAWCCGKAASKCACPKLKKMRKQMAIGFRKVPKSKAQGKKVVQSQWSGKVHRMCALWSSEVFVKDDPKQGSHLRLLEAAVKRGNSIQCKDADCRKPGATLGCRVKNCRRSYHYPCAERLASKCHVRMWDCLTIPVACVNHRYVEGEVDTAKAKFLPATVSTYWKTPLQNLQHYLGRKLLCEDIAEGREQVRIPCTNDVDDDPMPKIKYITKCWRKGQPVDYLHPPGTELAEECQGCGGPAFDSWEAPMSVHILGTSGSRESDDRIDWQSEPMLGRLPYNFYGILQLGPDSKDIVECNNRCKCGAECKNRELQKGLQVSLELFKTKDRGWGVRSLQQIPRGRFVVEYLGDVLTQAEAEEQSENHLSYLFNLDHPAVEHEDVLVLDGRYMSNIARFINHSCEGNLMIYRVYTETTVPRYFRIGMYAIEDIEVGQELTYDYDYAVSKESGDLPLDDPTAIRCRCGTPSCRNWLWVGANDTQLKQ